MQVNALSCKESVEHLGLQQCIRLFHALTVNVDIGSLPWSMTAEGACRPMLCNLVLCALTQEHAAAVGTADKKSQRDVITHGLQPDGTLLRTAKLQMLELILHDAVRVRKGQAIVSCSKPAVIRLLEEHLTELGFTCGMLYGDVKPADRDALCAQFRAGEIQVMLVQHLVTKGLNLPCATCVIFDPFYNKADLLQV